MIRLRLVEWQEQNLLLQLLTAIRTYFLRFPGVHSLDVGYQFQNRQPQDRLAIRAHVQVKKPRHALSAAELLPRQVDGIPFDVIQSRPVPQPEYTGETDQRFNPIIGGIAAGNARLEGFGTLGLVVYDLNSHDPMGLSAYHVFVGEGGHLGDPIIQPFVKSGENQIGALARWNEDLDCAVCRFNHSRAIANRILNIPNGVAGVTEPRIGMRLIKSGRTTGVTYGIIDGVGLDGFTVIPDDSHPASSGEISAPGDSGAVWLTAGESQAIGLHVAGEDDPDPHAERAWAKRISKVFAALKVTPFRPEAFHNPTHSSPFSG